MRVAIAYLTKDRVELTKQTFPPILQHDKFDVLWLDGSLKTESQIFFEYNAVGRTIAYPEVRGGADAAIVFALTKMLGATEKLDHGAEGFSIVPKYTHIGLCENDVLLAPDWFERTMALFEKGEADGLVVGAASARAYDDRILVQRSGYAVMFNLGAGHVIFTRQAAEIVLREYRTGWWPDTRSIFAQLSGVDIGRYACFRGNAQWTTADWHFDAALAQHGLASLALCPCAAEMIGQEPSLEEQGLRLVDREVEQLRNETAMGKFSMSTRAIREGEWKPQVITPVHRASMNGGASLIFPHQLDAILTGPWRLKWTQGLGPFSYRAETPATMCFEIFGPCVILVSGGDRATKVTVLDHGSGYEVDPEVPPAEHGITQLAVPGGVSYREIEVTCGAGAVFYGIQCQEPQPVSNRKFDYSVLPPV